MLDQKVEHVHNNPVEEGLVTLPEHYAYSSAHPASVLKCSGMRIEKAGGREGGGTRQTAERRVGKFARVAETRTVTAADGTTSTVTVMRVMTDKEVAAAASTPGVLSYTADDHVQYNTTTDQDKTIARNAASLARGFNSGRDEYNVLFDNCVDACQDAVQKNTGITLPLDGSPVPNSYFERLKTSVNAAESWRALPQAEKDKRAAAVKQLETKEPYGP